MGGHSRQDMENNHHLLALVTDQEAQTHTQTQTHTYSWQALLPRSLFDDVLFDIPLLIHSSLSVHLSPLLSYSLSPSGKSYTMIGRDDSLQGLGIIPCAISWLFKLINERKEKTGARFSVRVSAVEVGVTDETPI